LGLAAASGPGEPPYTYVLLLASAASNCNVQGECGADGSDSTLFWLKITRDLSLAGKQSFPISDCRAHRVAVTTADPGDPNFGTIQAKDLPWGRCCVQSLGKLQHERRPRGATHLGGSASAARGVGA